LEILLIAGIPASGKSYFGAWLEKNHSYLHVDVEEDGRLASNGLLPAWNSCYQAGNVDGFVDALKRLRRRVALDWGFPPRWLGIVQQFKVAGIALWWFHADHDAAREAFIARGDVSIEAFNLQMAAIKDRWSDIKATFAPNLVTTLRADRTRLEPKAIYKAMFG